MNDEIKASVEAIQKSFHDFKDVQKNIARDEAKGYADPLLKEQAAKIDKAIEIAEEARDAGLKAQALYKARNEIASSYEQYTPAKAEAKKAFAQFLRRGEQAGDKALALMAESVKSLSVTHDPGAGYLVIPDFDTDVLKIINETSPMRQVCRVKKISTDKYVRLVRTDRAGARWTDRNNLTSETTTPNFRENAIKVHGLEAAPKIHQNLIDDAVIDIVSEVRDAVAEEFELSENTAFVNGSGAGEPKGILKYDAGTAWGQIQQVKSGHASTLTPDGLIDLVTELKIGYLARASFILNRRSLAVIRKFKNVQGDYIWQPGLSATQPPSILGYPYMRAEDMDSVAAGKLPIAFGDFSIGYYIIDLIGTRILVNPFIEPPYVKYFTTKRVGGGAMNYEAFKLQVIAA